VNSQELIEIKKQIIEGLISETSCLAAQALPTTLEKAETVN